MSDLKTGKKFHKVCNENFTARKLTAPFPTWFYYHELIGAYDNTPELIIVGRKMSEDENDDESGKPLSFYSITGQLVYARVAKAEYEQIPVSVTGVYVVVSENQAVKVVLN